MITRIFGEMLFTPGSGLLRELPSPELLKRRIILSTKPPKEYSEAAKVRVKDINIEKGTSPADDESLRKEVPE